MRYKAQTKKITVLFIVLLLGWSHHSFSEEIHVLRQSLRARAMGGAFTAVANDEMLLYYNPAGLASVTHNMYEVGTLHLSFNQKIIDLISAIADSSGSTDEDEESAILSELANIAGEKAYVETGLGGLGITTRGWGYSIFSNFLMELTINNPAVPFFSTRAYAQTGGVAGFAMSFYDHKIDLGFSGKMISRAGLEKDIRVSDESIRTSMKAAGDEGGNAAIEELTRENISQVQLFSPDIGMMYHIDRIPNLYTKLALVVQNIGDMDFEKAGKIPMTVNAGLSTESELAGLDVIFAADYFDLTAQRTEKQSFLRSLKIGTEIGWWKLFNGHHFLAVRAGMNGGYPTMGFSVNVFGAKFEAVQWSEETGDIAGDKADKRYAIQGSLIF